MSWIKIGTERLYLLPHRAVFWERTVTLFIADPHWGDSALTDDLTRLSDALTQTEAKRLIVLGDLRGTAQGQDADRLKTVGDWRENHADLPINLVRSDQDTSAGDPPDDWRIDCMDGPTPGPYFVLNHTPIQPERGYALAGSLHPAVRLSRKDGKSLQTPCFWFGARCGVLPAFSGVAGTEVITPKPGDRVYARTGLGVVRVGGW